MLKYWVALLVVLNALALAWQWDALAPWGWGPQQHQEPERLKQQLRPEAIQPVRAPSAEDAAPAQNPSPSDTSAVPGSPAAPQLGSAPVLPSAPVTAPVTAPAAATAPR
jgi:cytoskeletal protein RodZ